MATYTTQEFGGPCKIVIRFEPANTLSVAMDPDQNACGFGNHTTPDGRFTKIRGGPPGDLVPQDAPPALPDAASLTKLAKSAKLRALAATPPIEGRKPEIEAAAARHKDALATVAAKKKELAAQIRAANAARQKLAAAAKRKVPASPLPELKKAAFTAFQTAENAARAFLAARKANEGVEDELAQLVSDVALGASDAQVAAGDVKSAYAGLVKLATAHVSESKKTAEASKKDPAKAPKAKELADEAKKSLSDLKTLARAETTEAQGGAREAKTAASHALTAAHFPAKGYAAYRAKSEKEDASVESQLAELEKTAASLHESAAPNAKPQAPAVKQCDLRKVDWMNWHYSGLPELKNGAWSEKTGDGENNVGIEKPTFADLDGDGSVEAIVTGMTGYFGATASQSPFLYVESRRPDCSVFEAGDLSSEGMCSTFEVKGNVILEENTCEGYVAEHRLVGGALKETKRRPR